MTDYMTAYGFTTPQLDGGHPPIEKHSIPVPVPEKRQILVKVKAVSLNPTDVATWSRKKESDDSLTVLGRDVSGTVVATGSDVTLFKEGDDVFYPGSSNIQGAQADFHVIDERMVSLKPKNLTHSEAAALPLTALTSYEVIHDRLSLLSQSEDPKDTTLLIIGAAGGVGSIACQIALNYGFTVIGTASREESTEHVKNLGVKHVINHKEPFIKQLKAIGFETVDAILLAAKADDNIKEAAQVIRPQGRVCSLLPLKEPLPLSFFSKSISFSYELMYTRSVYETPDWIKQHEYLTELKNQVEQGFIQSTLNTRYSEMNEHTLIEAYKELMSDRTLGKIVLEQSS